MPLPNLRVSREEARKKLQTQIETGKEIYSRLLSNEGDPKSFYSELYAWNKYNEDLLQHIYDDDNNLYDYRYAYNHSDLYFKIRGFTISQSSYDILKTLQSFIDRLELYDEPSKINSPISNPQNISREVFVVHGRDDGSKETVARFLTKLDLTPIILHEQANRGRTLMEKFKEHSDVAFTVVLLTPDDIGYLENQSNDPKPRARQNVIFELGFFIGKLEPKRVCVLRRGNVENPSDVDGIIYVDMDKENWSFILAREIKAAGIEIDLNKIVG